jgi:hypothetical protein
MALIKCKECSKEISSEAATCPHCGVKVKKSSSLGSGCLLVLVIVVVLGAITSLMDSTPSITPRPAKESKTPVVSIAHNSTAIELTNDGTPDWKTAEVYINGSPPFTYKATVAAPAVGQAVRIPLASFVKKDGERFNPATHALTEIWVGGGGYDFQSYKVSR